jgi:hypothetical protein
MLWILGLVCRVLRLRFVVSTVTILLLSAWGGASSAQLTPAPNWSQQSPATSPSIRIEATMAYDAGTNQVVLFGGDGGNGNLLNDTWTWNGTTWTQRTSAASPQARFGAMMAYDASTNQVVLFGGQNISGNFLNDTWTWNGTTSTWTQRTPATSPQARTAATMAYDAGTNQVVLFGGAGGSNFLGDTWTWNGTTSTWTQLSPVTSPAVREFAMMAYDAGTGLVVLFGGQNMSGVDLNDTWTWNGTTWTQSTPASSPSARDGAMMAYDASTNHVVLFGGANSNSGNSLGETWTWNGTTWTQLTPAANPSPRTTATMAYDTSTSQVVLFGGLENDPGPFLNDTWTLQQGAVNLGSANVCTPGAITPSPCSLTATLYFDVAADTTIGSINILTQGTPNLDFNATTTQESNACAMQTYISATICTVTVTFTPTKAGIRYGAVVIEDGTSNAPATAYVFGTGQGPQLAFSPPMQSTIPATGLINPEGVAVDGSGNVYITDTNNNSVLKETLAGGSYTQSTIPATGLLGPEGVAVDGSGNIYIANTEGGSSGNGNVLLQTLAGGSYTQSTIPATGLMSPIGVAVDGSGNVYIANFNGGSGGTGNVLKETLSGGSYTQSTIAATGLAHPIGVAVDGSGNVYIANFNGGSSGTGNVLKETLAGGSYTQSTVPATGLMNPKGVTVDGSGNVYIANTYGGSSGNGNVLKETLSTNGSYLQSTIPATSLDFPTGVAVDGSGNVYIPNFNGGSSGNGTVLEEDYADAPTLTFVTPTSDGTTDTTDGMFSVQIENIGNEPLRAISPGLSVMANFIQGEGSGTAPDCTATFSLAANGSCNISVGFAPVAPANGTVNGSVMLTDNNLNATPSAMQMITLTGTAVQIRISPTTLPSATLGVAYSATLTTSGGTAPYMYAINSGALPTGLTLDAMTGVLSGTPTAAGIFNFTVMVTDRSTGPVAPVSASQSYTLMVSPPMITISPAALPAATVGTAYSATLTSSGGTAPYTYTIISGPLPAGITLTGGVLAGTPTASGTFNFALTAADSSRAPGPYSATASYHLLVNAAAVTAPLDFTFTDTGASSFTAAPGAAAMYRFALAPLNLTYPGPVSFIVTGLPTGATATFTPSTVAVTAGATTVMMTVQTARAMAQSRRGPIGRDIILALLLLPFGIKRSLRRPGTGRMLLLLLLLAGTAAAMSGCGSSNGFLLQSPQTYTLTATATGGTLEHSQTVTLIVQ